MIDFLVGFAAAIALMWLLRRFFVRRKYLAACEYWVYLPGETMPPQDEVMQRLLGSFWRERGSQPAAIPISAAEGRLLSDVRLHVALILRSKNPHVFRPDLFGDTVVPTPSLLRALANAKALAKVRFVSETPLQDRVQLAFIPAMAGTVAHLGGSEAVFDVVGETLQPVEALEDALQDRALLDTAEWNARVVWIEGTDGGHAETRGLVKIGLPEVSTHDAPNDHRVLVCQVMEAAVQELWKASAIPPELTVEAYGDSFRLLFAQEARGPCRVRIQRLHEAG
ncbi:MAG: hypothetical protein M9921_09880 [Fimbriimonadaceae bacterium]|nr:hypothetical protein [Chthonomonadaceae bacterium]MCO5297153.1 hypothetical protein [Fimbriimonadaceae bacterium]